MGVTSGLAWGSTNFVAVGNVGTNAVVQFSADGNFWNQGSIIASVALKSVTYGNGRYIAVGQSNTWSYIATSNDGINWKSSTPAHSPLNAITVGGNTFVAVGNSGLILSSQDASTWVSQLALTNAPDLLSIAYGGGVFVASGYEMLFSTNGADWASSNANLPVLYHVVYGGGHFVGINASFISSSRDGKQWTNLVSRTGAVVPAFFDITYGNGIFVVVREYALITDVNLNYVLRDNLTAAGAINLMVLGGDRTGGRIQATIQLPGTNWFDLFSFSSNPTSFMDMVATNQRQRFYRVFSP